MEGPQRKRKVAGMLSQESTRMLHEAQSGAGKGSNPRKHVTVELEPTPRIRPEEVRISSRDNVIG
jgi:hypothetical protein